MNNNKVNNQEMYFNMMTKFIDEIRYTRLATGNDSKHHNEIWKKIDKYYDKLDYSYREAFNRYVN